MKRLFRQKIALLAISLILVASLHAQELPTGKPEDVGLSSDRLQRLTTSFEAYATDKKMAGSVVLVARHGKVAYFNAFGKRDLEANASMQNDVIFRIASQSKALISVGITIRQENICPSLRRPLSPCQNQAVDTMW